MLLKGKGKPDAVGISKDRREGGVLPEARRPAQAPTQIEGEENRARLAVAVTLETTRAA